MLSYLKFPQGFAASGVGTTDLTTVCLKGSSPSRDQRDASRECLRLAVTAPLELPLSDGESNGLFLEAAHLPTRTLLQRRQRAPSTLSTHSQMAGRASPDAGVPRPTRSAWKPRRTTHVSLKCEKPRMWLNTSTVTRLSSRPLRTNRANHDADSTLP